MAISARSRSEAETTAEGWPEGRGQSPSNHRAHDCKDAGGRAKQEARAENRSVYKIHEDSSTVLMYRMYGMPISPKAPTFGAGAKIGDAAIAEKDN